VWAGGSGGGRCGREERGMGGGGGEGRGEGEGEKRAEATGRPREGDMGGGEEGGAREEAEGEEGGRRGGDGGAWLRWVGVWRGSDGVAHMERPRTQLWP
jgi:hypothetical protein